MAANTVQNNVCPERYPAHITLSHTSTIAIANENQVSNSASASWLRDGVGCLRSSGEPLTEMEIAYVGAPTYRKVPS